MKELLLLAAQHAGVADVFHELVPKWAFGALFARIVGADACDHLCMSTTLLQDWLLEERMKVPSKAVLDLFLRSSNSETMSKAEFAKARRCCPLNARPVRPLPAQLIEAAAYGSAAP